MAALPGTATVAVGVALVSIAGPIPRPQFGYTNPADDLGSGPRTACGRRVSGTVWLITTGKASGSFQLAENVATGFRSPPSRAEMRFCRNGSLSSAPRLVQQ